MVAAVARRQEMGLGQELVGLVRLELSWLVMEKPVVAGAYRPATLAKVASQQQLGRGQGPKHLDHGSCPQGHGPAALAHLDPLELSAAKAHHHGLGQADYRTHVVKKSEGHLMTNEHPFFFAIAPRIPPGS